jgi:hypothetical protein
MDNDFPLDLAELCQMIDQAEVLVVRFPLVDKRLLLDAREGPGTVPRLVLVPRVASLDERYRYLRETRPSAPLPDRITFIPWPKRVETFQSGGVWSRLLRRVRLLDEEPKADELMAELQALELSEVYAAIGGTGYRTLWERPTA